MYDSESTIEISLLADHLTYLWGRLPRQSRQRLEVLAASALADVGPVDHGILATALEMIALEEGVLEGEAGFASYLGNQEVAQTVATGTPDFRQRLRRALGGGGDRDRKAISIDGEGVTLPDGSHVYRYLAAVTSDGTLLGELDEPDGIGARQALAFLSGLPKNDPRGVSYLGIFGFGLGYDFTKMLESLANKQLYELIHNTKKYTYETVKLPTVKVGRFRLGMLGRCLQITNTKATVGQKRTMVWDILPAFQSSFVKALTKWKVGSEEELARITRMKQQRGDFVNTDWTMVTAYCRDECRLLAALVEKYNRAHCDAGIDLKGKYFGAGSTGEAFLRVMDALKKQCGYEMADVMAWPSLVSARSRAFFGGRSEVSRVGIVRGPCYSYDVASAYPDAIARLPCVQHGEWRHVTGKKTEAVANASRIACVHYRVNPTVEETRLDVDDPHIAPRALVMGVGGDVSMGSWGPLPYRTEGGSIVFPTSGPGGWAWNVEYQAAKQNYPGVEARDAWCLESQCRCPRPYAQIEEFYKRRIDLGKDSEGIVIKLGMNSAYGKFAQVVGRAKYHCRAVAGVITATTRARILEAIASAEDRWSIVYVATDGIICDAKINPPDPKANGTKAYAEARGERMLGAWETPSNKPGSVYGDLFVLQPGFYFSIEAGGRIKTRGMPVEIIDDERVRILEQWASKPLEPLADLPKRTVFRGIRTSIRPPTKDDPKYRRKPSYGRWEEEERVIKYVINPKRSHTVALVDGVNPETAADEQPSASAYRLLTWYLYADEEESAEYKKDDLHAETNEWYADQPDFVDPPGTDVGD